MRIEYVADGSPDAPLLRIFDFTASELARLVQTFDTLANQSGASARASESSAAALVTLTSGSRDRGVIRKNNDTWEWSLTPESWADVRDRARQVDALTHEQFQWLSEIGQISVLLSLSGRW
jgi:hypothetical protein